MAGFALAGRLAPLIAKAGIKLGGALGKGQGSQAVRNVAAAASKNLRKEGVANALNLAGEGAAEALSESRPQVIGETLGGLIQGGLGAGLGAGAANLGTTTLLGALAGPAAGRTGLRALAGNPATQQIVGQLASQAAVGLLGNRSQTIPAQTITPDQQIQAMQLQAQLQGNLAGANSQDLAAALNAGTAISSTAGSFFNTAPYQVTTFDA